MGIDHAVRIDPFFYLYNSWLLTNKFGALRSGGKRSHNRYSIHRPELHLGKQTCNGGTNAGPGPLFNIKIWDIAVGDVGPRTLLSSALIGNIQGATFWLNCPASNTR